MRDIKNIQIGIIGLGYVGLPLAVEFSKKYSVVGYDINENRIAELKKGEDSTLECSPEELKQALLLEYSSVIQDLNNCNVYIVTVPTPINKFNQPDLSPLIKASEMLGSILKNNDVVIYESTVYPGATEEDCVPILEESSGLKYNKDFFCGYSPERINPGDKLRKVANIKKVTSGSNREIAKFVDEIYSSIIVAGTHLAPSIKVAEASKVIENVQRDVNIALVNELHQVFSKLDINTRDVIEAASTKWNFMKLMPGLVGGHCIGVDPYYLLHKSKSKGYIPDLIRTAREINNFMPEYIAKDFLLEVVKRGINPCGLTVALFGFTFKENCPDVRNTKSYDLYKALQEVGFKVNVYDTWANATEVKEEYGLEVSSTIDSEWEVGILAVGHSEIIEELKSSKNMNKYVYDFKSLMKP